MNCAVACYSNFLSMWIIDDDSELDRILETTNFEHYELIDINESLDELTGVGMAPASDTPSTSELELRKEVQWN